MRYVPHTPNDVAAMLETIGAASIDELLAPVPAACREPDGPQPWPEPLTEPELRAHLAELARRNTPTSAMPCFLGAGAYHHHIPAVVDALSSRGEFLTAYTPYQAEASQGTLQVIFEFQTLVSELAALPVANASLYDGATALVEALFMLHAGPRGRRAGEPGRLLLSEGIHPEYRETVRTYVRNLPLEVHELPLDERGRTDLDALREAASEASVFAFQNPAFPGTLDDAAAVCETAREAGAQVVQIFCPIGAALLTPPGEAGAHAAVAEGQPLGNPIHFGGPHLGLLAADAAYVRRMPGRMVGRSTDRQGRTAYTLTLQTREQHIRRERATSNICTNVGLLATRATIYLAALGAGGLRQLATTCLERAHHAAERIAAIEGFSLRYPDTPFFREVAIRCPLPAAELGKALLERGIIGGLDLARFVPGEDHTMLFAFTECTTPEHIEQLAGALEEITA